MCVTFLSAGLWECTSSLNAEYHQWDKCVSSFSANIWNRLQCCYKFKYNSFWKLAEGCCLSCGDDNCGYRMDKISQATSPPAYYNITGCTKGASSVDSITSNGGFIASAAGLSIVIPIVCVLIVQLRRAKKAERARLRAAPVASDIEADDPRIFDLPPPYEEVFGPNFNSLTTVVHAGYSSNFEILIDENEVARQRSDYTDYQTESGLTNVFRDQQPPGVTNTGDDMCDASTCAWNVRTHSDNADSLIATLSVSPHIGDIASDTNVLRTSNTGSQSTSTLNTLQLETYADLPAVSTPALLDHAHLFVPSSVEDRINSQLIPPQVCANVAPRRHPGYPGMHISFEDFSPRGYQDNQVDSPPPSYEEALHILEKIELAKDGLH
ncbi:hypothetical protein BsWGS_09783 [Bradybaena similaris]